MGGAWAVVGGVGGVPEAVRRLWRVWALRCGRSLRCGRALLCVGVVPDPRGLCGRGGRWGVPVGRPQGEGGRTGDLLLILVMLIGRGRLEVGGRGWPVRLQSVMTARGHGRGRRGRRAAHGHCVDVPGMVAGLMHAQAVLVLEHLGAQGTAHLKGVVGPLEVQR